MFEDTPVHGLQCALHNVAVMRAGIIHVNKVLVYVVPDPGSSQAK